MKNKKDISMRRFFTMILLASLVSSPLAAEALDKKWEVGVFGDYIKSSTNKESITDWQNIEAGKGIGIDLKKIINEQWSARLELAKTRYDIQNGNDSDDGTRFGIDAIYKVEDTGLYLFTGVKRFYNARNYYAVNVGAGYNVELNERLSAYTEAVVYRDVNNGYNDQGFKVGLKYAFGDVKKSPVVKKVVEQKLLEQTVEVIDTDNDGVTNSNDHCHNTSANVKVDSRGCALYSEKEVAVNLNVLFDNNSSQLNKFKKNDIQPLADFMKEYKNTSVVIEGHSSVVGNTKYNLVLSQKRADKIKNLLINKFSIDANRLSSKGFGDTKLIFEGNTDADHSKNRRVVATIETTVKTVIEKD